MKIFIYDQTEKQRLDKFLVEKMPEFPSRVKIQKAIKEGLIKVNNQAAVIHYFLKKDDQITVELAKEKRVKEEKILFVPEIIEQTEDWLVLNKPAGLIVHPGQGIKEPTLSDWLKENFPSIKNIGDDPLRPGIVHRLDKDVSGLMVIALKQKSFEYLKKQFKNREIKKRYLCLVYGIIKSDEDTIDFPLERSEISGRMAARPQGKAGKDSLTNFTVLKRFSRYTLIEVEILTGRTHQIRAHLQAYGHPLVGDKIYFNKKIKDTLKLKRLFLHSHFLGFKDLEGAWQEFQSDLPLELKTILNKLQ